MDHPQDVRHIAYCDSGILQIVLFVPVAFCSKEKGTQMTVFISRRAQPESDRVCYVLAQGINNAICKMPEGQYTRRLPPPRRLETPSHSALVVARLTPRSNDITVVCR